MAQRQIDAFTRAYLHAAAFTEDPKPPQGKYPEPSIDELDPDFVAQAIRDCESFRSSFGQYFADDEDHAARDFWYTRNGHGCGFWDGDWPEPAATILTEASKTFGEVCADVFATTAVEDE